MNITSIDEGYDEIDNKEVVDAAVSISTGEIQKRDTSVLSVVQEEGYYNENDFDEDGVMGDEMQKLGNAEDLFDNDFNV